MTCDLVFSSFIGAVKEKEKEKEKGMICMFLWKGNIYFVVFTATRRSFSNSFALHILRSIPYH